MVGVFSVNAYVGVAGGGVCEFFYGADIDVPGIEYLYVRLAYLRGDGVVAW